MTSKVLRIFLCQLVNTAVRTLLQLHSPLRHTTLVFAREKP